MEVHQSLPQLPTAGVEAVSVNCRVEQTVSIKKDFDGNHMVSEQDRFDVNTISPHNPNVTPQSLVFEPIFASTESRELADVISVHRRFQDKANVDEVFV